MTARGRDKLPEIVKFVANYMRNKFRIIRDYGRLFEITNDYSKIVSQLRLYRLRVITKITTEYVQSP